MKTYMNIIKSLPVVRALYWHWIVQSFRRRWRKRNRHNQTYAVNMFCMECVSVGKYSYGPLNVFNWSDTESLKIGNFVSIAAGVTFVLGGNHQMQTVTTFPAYAVFGGIQGRSSASICPLSIKK